MTTDTQPMATQREFGQFLSDVMTAAGLVTHGKQCKALGDRLADMCGRLRRWGQPARSGEPVGYLYCGGSYGDELAEWEIVADQLQCDRLNEHHGALGKEARLPLYTAPQPVERAPLTQAQVVEAFCALPHQVQFVTAFDQGVRFAERYHGIKGGQHVE